MLTSAFQRLALAIVKADDAYHAPARAHTAAEGAFYASPSEALRRCVQRAERKDAKANDALWAATMAALRHPTAEPADIAVKQAMLGECLAMQEFEPIAAMLEATLAAILQISSKVGAI